MADIGLMGCPPMTDPDLKCPNSALTLQAQVADIGLMGCPTKKDGKAVEGVRIFLGGSIGENAQLASEFEKASPLSAVSELFHCCGNNAQLASNVEAASRFAALRAHKPC